MASIAEHELSYHFTLLDEYTVATPSS